MVLHHIYENGLSRAALCLLVLAVPLHSKTANIPQGDTRAKVTQAVALYPKDASGAYTILRSLGVSAIPYIVEAIKDDSDKSPLGTLKKARTNPFLVDVIAEMEGAESDAALIELLMSDDAIVRGAATTSLGRRKTEAAVPYLIQLLDDKSPYMGFTVTHPSGSDSSPSEVTLLVSDVAAQALRNITGVNPACGATRSEQAKVWRRWWQGKQKVKHARY